MTQYGLGWTLRAPPNDRGVADDLRSLHRTTFSLRAAEIAKLAWSMVLDARGLVAAATYIEEAIAKWRGCRRVLLHPDLREVLTKLQREPCTAPAAV